MPSVRPHLPLMLCSQLDHAEGIHCLRKCPQWQPVLTWTIGANAAVAIIGMRIWQYFMVRTVIATLTSQHSHLTCAKIITLHGIVCVTSR